ncbi:PH domain-containing protein [Staphylococcus chromogenes]|nr:PH domain-containing protein [Staphylococcus chromogenes]
MTEEVRYDLTAPLSTMTFPVVESLLITALSWMAVGFVDRSSNPQLHNLVVLVWALLLLWRLIIPLLRKRRQRFAVTTQRLIVRAGRFRAREDSIPMQHIIGASRRRGTVLVEVAGYDRALAFPDVPKAKRVVAEINELARGPRPYW